MVMASICRLGIASWSSVIVPACWSMFVMTPFTVGRPSWAWAAAAARAKARLAVSRVFFMVGPFIRVASVPVVVASGLDDFELDVGGRGWLLRLALDRKS